MAQCKYTELTPAGHGSKAQRSYGGAACWGTQAMLLVASAWTPCSQLDLHPGAHPEHLFAVPSALGMQCRDTSPGSVVGIADIERYLSTLVACCAKSAVLSADLSWPGSSLPMVTWHSRLQTCAREGGPAAGTRGSSCG